MIWWPRATWLWSPTVVIAWGSAVAVGSSVGDGSGVSDVRVAVGLAAAAGTVEAVGEGEAAAVQPRDELQRRRTRGRQTGRAGTGWSCPGPSSAPPVQCPNRSSSPGSSGSPIGVTGLPAGRRSSSPREAAGGR